MGLEVIVVRNVTPSNVVEVYRCLTAASCIYLQVRRVSQADNILASISKMDAAFSYETTFGVEMKILQQCYILPLAFLLAISHAGGQGVIKSRCNYR
jgi:hypothetical protein